MIISYYIPQAWVKRRLRGRIRVESRSSLSGWCHPCGQVYARSFSDGSEDQVIKPGGTISANDSSLGGGSSALRQACTDTVVCAKRRINRPRLGGLHTMCLLPYHRLCERPELFLLSPLRVMKGTFLSFCNGPTPLVCKSQQTRRFLHRIVITRMASR